jgi:hypothetical protein
MYLEKTTTKYKELWLLTCLCLFWSCVSNKLLKTANISSTERLRNRDVILKIAFKATRSSLIAANDCAFNTSLVGFTPLTFLSGIYSVLHYSSTWLFGLLLNNSKCFSAPTKAKASSINSFSSSQPELYTNWAKFPSVHCAVYNQIITHSLSHSWIKSSSTLLHASSWSPKY